MERSKQRILTSREMAWHARQTLSRPNTSITYEAPKPSREKLKEEVEGRVWEYCQSWDAIDVLIRQEGISRQQYLTPSVPRKLKSFLKSQ